MRYRCKSELQLEHIFLEVGQAIYNKVLQVLFNQQARYPSFCNKLIVRMGGFYVVLCLLKTIYSRFYNSGIVELLVEAGVGSDGSIRSAMKSSDVKLGIRPFFKQKLNSSRRMLGSSVTCLCSIT